MHKCREKSGTSLRAKVLVLDGKGVLYGPTDHISRLLVPFVRAHGCEQTYQQIAELYYRCSSGEFSSRSLWRALRVEGNSGELDRAFVSTHRLTPGAREFLKRMKVRNVPVACLTNDVTEWAHQHRRVHHLRDFLFHWTVSGEVKARKPDRRIYEAFHLQTGLAYHECLFVDDQVRNLDAARALGFRTALFRQNTSEPSGGRHPAHGFDDLAKLLGAGDNPGSA